MYMQPHIHHYCTRKGKFHPLSGMHSLLVQIYTTISGCLCRTMHAHTHACYVCVASTITVYCYFNGCLHGHVLAGCLHCILHCADECFPGSLYLDEQVGTDKTKLSYTSSQLARRRVIISLGSSSALEEEGRKLDIADMWSYRHCSPSWLCLSLDRHIQ